MVKIDRARIISPIIPVLLLVLVLLILFVPIRGTFNFYDEGFAVFNATRILAGDVPYRDFWALYPPGQFYILAAVFKFLGTSQFVSRLLDTFTRLVIVLSVWQIARKLTARAFAYAALIAAVLLVRTSGAYSYAVYTALALGFLAVLCLMVYIEQGRVIWLLLAGLLIGLLLFVRWDIGLYFGLGIVIAASWFRFSHNSQFEHFSSRLISILPEIALFMGRHSSSP